MNKVNELVEIVNGFSFQKREYLEAEEQLVKFVDRYSKLNVDEADQLRLQFDEKERLGLFRVASTLFRNSFPNAGEEQKVRLCRIFFALYSFDNLGFGYDSVLDVMDVVDSIRGYDRIAKNAWLPFRKLTSNPTAQKNLENKLFGGRDFSSD